MAALLIDLQPGDEVIMPSYTFVLITSSPGCRSINSAAISSDAVQEGVSSTFLLPKRCSILWQ
jgi:hypothetical protein